MSSRRDDEGGPLVWLLCAVLALVVLVLT